jgi:hypothetical protein
MAAAASVVERQPCRSFNEYPHRMRWIRQETHVRVDEGLTSGGKRQRRPGFVQTMPDGRWRLGQSRGQWGSSVVRLPLQAAELRLDEGNEAQP